MKVNIEKKEAEIRKRLEEELRGKIAQEADEKKEQQKAIKAAEEAAEEAKKVAEMKAEQEELRKLAKAEAKKDAMRLAVRRKADEILAKEEYQTKISRAAHKYNGSYNILSQQRNRADESSDSSDSDSD